MALTIISEPTSSPVPTPVSDCLRWCFQPDDADIFSTPGSNASVSVVFPATISTIPADGTEFTIWGRTFTVDSTNDYTQNSFKIVSSGNQTGTNFRNMLRANFFFARSTQVAANGNLRSTLVTWNTCGEQDNFTGVNMDFAALVTAGATATATNGVTPVMVDGAMVQVRLLRADAATNVFLPITKYEGIQPSGSCDVADELCIDFMQDAKRTLYTPLPALTATSEIDPEETTMVAKFKINVGVTWRDASCQPQSGAFVDSDEILVMDTVFDTRENLGMRRYIYDHPENLGLGGQPALSPQFLTNKPPRLTLGVNSFAWLWMAAGYQSLAPTDIKVRFNVFYKNGTTAFVDVDYAPILEYKVHCFNVSPARLLTLFGLVDLSTVSHYFVRATADTGDPVGWETYFAIEHACENMVDVYFKTPPGGIGTLLCELVESEIVQEGTEICLNVPCGASRAEQAAYGGRMMNNIRAYEKVTLRARRNFTPEEIEYFKSLKASPERWIQVEETGEIPFGGAWIAKKLLVEPGGVRIYQQGEYIDLVITGSIGELTVQTPRGV
jgi:hypothetical protein